MEYDILLSALRKCGIDVIENDNSLECLVDENNLNVLTDKERCEVLNLLKDYKPNDAVTYIASLSYQKKIHNEK